MAALAQGQKERAARLLGAAEALREALGLGIQGAARYWRRLSERMGEAVRAASLEQAFAAAWAEGRAMSLEQAIGAALEAEPAADRIGGPWGEEWVRCDVR